MSCRAKCHVNLDQMNFWKPCLDDKVGSQIFHAKLLHVQSWFIRMARSLYGYTVDVLMNILVCILTIVKW